MRIAMAVMASLVLAGSACAAPVGTRFVASDFNNNAFWLDAGMNNLGAFTTGLTFNNGVAFNPANSEILIGTFDSGNHVNRFDLNGNLVGSFGTQGSNLQGMTVVGAELAIADGGSLVFVDPVSGVFIRSVPNPAGGTTEGLAYRPFNNAIYTIDDSLIRAVDPANGNLLFTIPNPAAGSSFDGTSLTWDASTDELVAGALSGAWWRFDPLSGIVNSSGNNGLQMLGLEYVVVPAPAAGLLAGLGALAGARRRRR